MVVLLHDRMSVIYYSYDILQYSVCINKRSLANSSTSPQTGYKALILQSRLYDDNILSVTQHTCNGICAFVLVLHTRFLHKSVEDRLVFASFDNAVVIVITGARSIVVRIHFGMITSIAM